MSNRPRPGSLAVAGVLSLLLTGGLSACSVSDEQLRPGVAAQVGDTEVALDTIDAAIDDACTFFSDQDQPGFPRSLARQQFVSVLIQRAAAGQALDEDGVALADSYDAAVGGLDEANAAVPEEQRDAFVLLGEATSYIEAAATSLGEAAFAAEGDVPPDPAVLVDRGRSVISAWLDDNDVAINPVFRLTVDNGQVVAELDGTSVAVSDEATLGQLDPLTATEDQVATAAATLPASQLCGASDQG